MFYGLVTELREMRLLVVRHSYVDIAIEEWILSIKFLFCVRKTQQI